MNLLSSIMYKASTVLIETTDFLIYFLWELLCTELQ